MLRVGGGVAVLPLSVVPVLVLVGAAPGEAVSVGVVGCCRCCPGGVLTAEGGPRHSWRRFP